MSQLASLARFAFGTVLVLALGGACGGRSFDAGDDAGGSSAGGTASQGATSSTSGKSPGGGSTGTGGSNVTPVAGTTSTSGTGSGGSANSACNAPSDSGPCNAYQPSWFHDASTGICRPFVYGGCGGNENRYASLEDCQKVCRSQGPNYDACAQPSDCIITGTGCCGVCDGPSLTKHDFIAYHRKYQPLLQCAGVPLELPAPGNGDTAGAPIACPGCPEIQGGFLKNFVPDCVRNECVVVDLRDAEFTACMTSQDCGYRLGTSCCQTCDVSDAIPLRKDVSIEGLVCGSGPVACGACPPIAPRSEPIPQCGANNRCELSYLLY